MMQANPLCTRPSALQLPLQAQQPHTPLTPFSLIASAAAVATALHCTSCCTLAYTLQGSIYPAKRRSCCNSSAWPHPTAATLLPKPARSVRNTGHHSHTAVSPLAHPAHHPHAPNPNQHSPAAAAAAGTSTLSASGRGRDSTAAAAKLARQQTHTMVCRSICCSIRSHHWKYSSSKRLAVKLPMTHAALPAHVYRQHRQTAERQRCHTDSTISTASVAVSRCSALW